MYETHEWVKSLLDNKQYPVFTDKASWIPSTEDLLVLVVWVPLLTLLRKIAQSYFESVATRLKVKESFKFSEACWKVLFYTISWTLGMAIVWKLELFPETANCWLGWPHIHLEWFTRHYYLFQLGFYIHSLYAHFAYEVKRKDFWPLLFHHIVTISLIYFSYVTGFHRIGLLVLVCHDVNDILFELGKTYVYRNLEPQITYTFILIMLGWVISRLLIFPFIVIRSSMIESLDYVPRDVFPFYYQFTGSLLFLLVLHFYWFGLMVQMAFRVATGKEKGVTDSREDLEDRKTK